MNIIWSRFTIGFVMQHPLSIHTQKQTLGVVDLSTTWKNHNTLGILAAERCASIIQSALLEQQRQHLHIGHFRRRKLNLTAKVYY